MRLVKILVIFYATHLSIISFTRSICDLPAIGEVPFVKDGIIALLLLMITQKKIRSSRLYQKEFNQD